MIYAVEYKGKGKDKADFITFHKFETENEYESYRNKHENLEKKYWTHIEKIKLGVEYEIYYNC